MNKIILSVVLAVLCTADSAVARQSIVSTIYCSLFGNQDASQEYKKLVYQALTDLGINNPEDVPVKKMNGVGSILAGMDVSSFTAFGIWLDEQHLDTCTQEEKLFHIYHEASHYACKHHQKTLIGSAASIPLIILGLMKLGSLSPHGSVAQYISTTSALLLTLSATYLYILPHVVKKQERQADVVAAKTLINIGKEEVVDEYINHIRASKNCDNNIWWYSNAEQIRYLENARNTLTTKTI